MNIKLDKFYYDALDEVGNILADAYYNALSKFLNLNIIPSTPTMSEGHSSDLMEKCNKSLKRKMEHVFGLNTLFEIEALMVTCI